jgi:hypothetical protein
MWPLLVGLFVVAATFVAVAASLGR